MRLSKKSLLTYSVLQIAVVKLNHEIPAISFFNSVVMPWWICGRTISVKCFQLGREYLLSNVFNERVKRTSSTIEKSWQSMAIISPILWWMRFAKGSLFSQIGTRSLLSREGQLFTAIREYGSTLYVGVARKKYGRPYISICKWKAEFSGNIYK